MIYIHIHSIQKISFINRLMKMYKMFMQFIKLMIKMGNKGKIRRSKNVLQPDIDYFV